MAIVEITVPDLEGAADVAVVEVYVSAGDIIEVETPLISLESDKAVMDVPSTVSGEIVELSISEGDTVNTGDVIGKVKQSDSAGGADGSAASAGAAAADSAPDKADSTSAAPDKAGSTAAAPDKADSTSTAPDKAAAPAESGPPSGPAALEKQSPSGAAAADTSGPAAASQRGESAPTASQTAAAPQAATPPKAAPINAPQPGAVYHATPSVRSLSRELGVDLSRVSGSGPKGRITREDVTALVKQVMGGNTSASVPSGAFSLPPIAEADYAAFGAVETEELSRIKRISGPHLHRNWIGIPHVTQFEEADITDLELFRKTLNAEQSASGEPKISLLIFIIQAAARTLKQFPDFNSSLNTDGKTLTRKKYINIGIAVDTPGGLVVPVIRNADAKGTVALSRELSDLSSRAREGKLKADEMKGGTFSISSLGGIGGRFFTPIVNAPETAILGVSRALMQPVWNGSEFTPRLMLPLSLSYDHRVIDGALGARFAASLASMLADLRRALL